MDKSKSIVPVEGITNKILILRNEKVLLDRDLAELYGVETRVLNQAVGRNIGRFPDDFMFELSREEIRSISQNVTSSNIKFSKRVRAFTEQGVAMLSSVLNSERAITVNIEIMRAFVRLREILSTHKDLVKKINEMEKKYDHQFQLVFEAIKALMKEEEKPKRRIGFQVEEPKAKYKANSSF
jgi:hypothetical protein